MIFRYLLIFLLGFSLLNGERPSLIVNASSSVKRPRNLRLTTQKVERTEKMHPSLHGLKHLDASASSQFSEKGLHAILSEIPAKKILIVDLRQESHGFIDGTAVSWTNEHNWPNLGKTFEEILADEEKRLNSARSWDHLMRVQSEEELVRSYGADYLRIPVADHRRAEDAQVDRFVALLKDYDGWVHFHCSAGKGRATQFLVLYDIMRNGDSVAFEDILLRQALLGGKNLLDESDIPSWKINYIQERRRFLETFYRYWIETKGEITWSQYTQR